MIDAFLNRITMYRLVLYSLIAILVFAVCLSAVGVLSFSITDLLVITFTLLLTCLTANHIMAYIFKAIPNIESAYITALILSLVITPSLKYQTIQFAILAGSLAIAAKYILAPYRKHIFNPAAFGIATAAFLSVGSANWWVGTRSMTPAVVVTGLLIARKTKREYMIAVFTIVALCAQLVVGLSEELTLSQAFQFSLLDSPLLFFAFIMLTEPFTSPRFKLHQTFYASTVGVCYAGIFHIGPVFFTPELALLVGNLFAYCMGDKHQYRLTVKAIIKKDGDLLEAAFQPDRPIHFTPGQYMEWTITTPHADSRGNRRYFTIASSPTEEQILLGIKLNKKPSKFKESFSQLKKGDCVIASQLAGDFVLPDNKNLKLVWIAGGIGITPFRSMTKYLIDMQQNRDIVLFHSIKSADENVYQDIFNQATTNGVKTIYTLSDTTNIPQNWQWETGLINAAMIRSHVPDYKTRIYYISGPHSMVTAMQTLLEQLGIPKTRIEKDYFPGFA